MTASEHTLACDGVDLPATLAMPSGAVRAGIVLLHPSADGSREQTLFRHSAEVLPEYGVAVLRYDRRASPSGDTPFDTQSADLRVAFDLLRSLVPGVPMGLWGASQGAWIALRSAARDDDIRFLILVGCSAVSPARQMRYGTATQLRAASFDDSAIQDLETLRGAYEEWVRGESPRDEVQGVIDSFHDREWFPIAWVPSTLPDDGPHWKDMDFDPVPLIRGIGCPVLAFWGDDEWVPVAESVEIWRREYPVDGAGLSVEVLPRSRHLPVIATAGDVEEIDPDYATTLVEWIDERLVMHARACEARVSSERLAGRESPGNARKPAE